MSIDKLRHIAFEDPERTWIHSLEQDTSERYSCFDIREGERGTNLCQHGNTVPYSVNACQLMISLNIYRELTVITVANHPLKKRQWWYTLRKMFAIEF